MRPAAVLAALLLAGTAQAGPWTRSAGSYYAKTGADGFYALSWAQSGVASSDNDRYLGQVYSLYGEAGLPTGHPTQIAVSAPLSIGTLWFTRRDNGARAEGRATVYRFGDLRLTPQIALHPTKPIALALETKIPMYQVDSVCDQDPTFKELCPRPGEGQIDLMPTLMVGGGFAEGKAFTELSVGYLHRTEIFLGWKTKFQFQDSLVVQPKIGVWTGKLLTMGRVYARVAPKNDGASQQWVSVGPDFLFDVAEGVGIEGGVSADVWALNAARGLKAGLGLSVRK